MSRRSRSEPELLELQEQITRWRAHRKGHRMPAELWEAAAGAARRHGVSYVSSMLGLGYTGLKARVGAPVIAGPVPAFVELRGTELLGRGAPEVVKIEVERGLTRMTITLPASCAPEMIAAVSAFARS